MAKKKHVRYEKMYTGTVLTLHLLVIHETSKPNLSIIRWNIFHIIQQLQQMMQPTKINISLQCEF